MTRTTELRTNHPSCLWEESVAVCTLGCYHQHPTRKSAPDELCGNGRALIGSRIPASARACQKLPIRLSSACFQTDRGLALTTPREIRTSSCVLRNTIETPTPCCYGLAKRYSTCLQLGSGRYDRRTKIRRRICRAGICRSTIHQSKNFQARAHTLSLLTLEICRAQRGVVEVREPRA